MSRNTKHNAHTSYVRSPEQDALYRLAEASAGYFTASQAANAGYSRSLLAYHANAGNFERVGHGIYRLRRFPESPHADLFVATLRAGEGSALSHESALALWGLSDALPSEVHITVPRTASRRRSGMRLHTGALSSAETTLRDGVPVTTVERTIADVARSGLQDALVLQAIAEALHRGLTTRQRLEHLAEARGGRTKRLVDRALR